MLDRASTFRDEKVVALLRTRFVPVAIDVWYEERRKDGVGDFYRKVVFQREGMRKGRTTQGFYVFDPAGRLLVGWNNRDTAKVRRRLEETARTYRPGPGPAAIAGPADPRYSRTPPVGGAVVDVHTKIVRAEWPGRESRWARIHRNATGRDHLWIRADEVAALAAGRWPSRLTRRIARFHLVDDTRGEPPMWRPEEVREAAVQVRRDGGALRVEGTYRLRTEEDRRGYDAAVLGWVATSGDRVTRFDLVCRGTFFGEGRWTRGAPQKPFTLAVAFRLADPGSRAAAVPPQGARDLRGYLEAR